ncbi:uncharacterized protein LY89DRAFT_655061 [Mollisia scopiformis]|uniref:Uncharacterized protein n=1 Tax=Mollisia scopiformis TaxID=149040 RepID=A0A194WTJ3_MOLSC|nr:uncharacterized protein LY89DRAFT_655061 [Mollisia scopiformis]KUJ11281.1 hypothetical protein LY89DRAFT_655061 [Mollisia scopiformis]
MNTHLADFGKLKDSSPPNPTPTRPKHLTTRSISEITSIPKVHKHHHHPHLHHRDKDPAASNPTLKVQPSVVDVVGGERSRSEGVTPNESRNVSRRGSVNVAVVGPWEDSVGMGALQREKRVVKEGEVREERERGALRAAELRNALMGLNTLSNNTTRRLDNTYYSVLEKLSVLQSTISSLKELASMTKDLNQEFKNESEELVREVSAQLEGFGSFAEQEKRIGDLQERVKAGRERIKALGGRVDIVKDRVEGWERAEGEWQERTRKNLRILWIVISCFIAVLLALVAFQYTPAMTGPEVPRGLNTTGLLGKVPDFESFKNESQALKREVEERLDGSMNRAQPEENPRLRVFDEL